MLSCILFLIHFLIGSLKANNEDPGEMCDNVESNQGLHSLTMSHNWDTMFEIHALPHIWRIQHRHSYILTDPMRQFCCGSL